MSSDRWQQVEDLCHAALAMRAEERGAGPDKRRFAKGRPRSQNGPEIDDFRPVFYLELAGVGCRVMVVGRRLGTLAATLRPMPMCAFWAHVVVACR
jgi:hypothetical protein